MEKINFIKLSFIAIVITIFTACNGGTKSSEKKAIESVTNQTTTSSDYRAGVILSKLQPADPLYIVYEDAENGDTEGWKITDNKPSGATITNVFDEDKGNRVIELKGDGTKNAYMLGSWGGSKAWNNHEDTLLKWSMKFSESFRLYIRIDTKKGSRYIRYSNEDKDRGLSGNRIYIGLGANSIDGSWHNFSRDIAVDLKTYESDNELVSINGFLLYGSGRVDDIKLKKSSKEIYEDAQNGNSDGWVVNDNEPSGATISNVYDNEIKSRVIELRGQGKKNRYALGERNKDSSWENSSYQVLKWSMRYSEDFIVEISTETNNGERILTYTPTNKDGGLDGKRINFGVGEFSKNGTWQTFVRDLASDIQKYEPNNALIQINGFAIRGSGKIDNIEMLKREKNIYSNGDDVSKWKIYDKKPAGATISTVYDNSRESNVIEFNGDGTKNGYVLGYWSGSRAWYNRENRILQWSMKFSEKFIITIRLDTKKGDRYLVYEPKNIERGISRNRIYFALGDFAKNGTWQTFTRDLEADLEKYESDNEIISVNGFFIKGSGRIDDVEMMHFSPLLANNIAPTIKLKGDNPTRLVVGEKYNEEGIVVTDDRDSNIDVVINSNVDTTKVGTYTITYTATDLASNMSKATRTVTIVQEDKTPPTIELLGGNPMSIKKESNYIEDGAVVTDNVDSNINLVISGTVDTTKLGSYILTYIATDRFGNSSKTIRKVTVTAKNDSKYNLEYQGLKFYQEPLPSSSYGLKQLSNDDFNGLTPENKLIVADKLLSTLFFGYFANELTKKIDSGNFINDIKEGLNEEQTDRVVLEESILDEDKFYQNSSTAPMVKVLNRFYNMKHLDRYLFDNWTAYILTQTIMFSPAYELETSEIPNVSRVYNNLVKSIEDDEGMRFITYKHMMSEDNWRRFRSPEDNGREMLEIFTLDGDDTHVPLSAKALQNWRLDPISNTLVVELNQNIEPIELFNTTIFTGVDFYRELVKSDAFIYGVTKRLVDSFFFDSSERLKRDITNSIVLSHPERWRDILKQIIFSEEYLLRNSRAKKAEETFFSLTKKLNYQYFYQTAYYFRKKLEEMHQATMKYKLGKLNPVPLDTLSFANYHKYIREFILTRESNLKYSDNYKKWSRQGWSPSFIDINKFEFNKDKPVESLDSLINLIFKSTVAREATSQEIDMFHSLMIQNSKTPWQFDIFVKDEDADKQNQKRQKRRSYVAHVVLEYISRLEETYKYKEVK